MFAQDVAYIDCVNAHNYSNTKITSLYSKTVELFYKKWMVFFYLAIMYLKILKKNSLIRELR